MPPPTAAAVLAEHRRLMGALQESERLLRWELTRRRELLGASRLGQAVLAAEDAAAAEARAAARRAAALTPRRRALLALTPLGRAALAEGGRP